MDILLKKKLGTLQTLITGLRPLMIAFSGGTDSTFLLQVAQGVLGKKVVATIARSPLHPARDYEAALRLAEGMGVKPLTLEVDLISIPEFRRNAPERCYYCKKAVFGKMAQRARELNIPHVADGTNADDTDDYRPGMKALAELGIRSPLKEVNLTKAEIRELSWELGLSTWNKPAEACLASRFPYGEEITPEKIEKVEDAEEHLRCLGFSEIRVRYHHHIARIEVSPAEIPRFMNTVVRSKVLEHMKKGFSYVALDLEGYRRGSMNEVLSSGSESPPLIG